MNKFLHALKSQILVLDGAMGTFIQAEGLEGNNDEFSRTYPEVIAKIHRLYLAAGADIIETNSFNANSISQADYGLEKECYEINLAAAQVARAAADEFSNAAWPRFVAGSMGPTNKTASMSSDVEDPGARQARYDDFVAAYSEQARGLIDGGCDLLLVETVFDTLNCKAALHAIANLFASSHQAIPVVVSGTITDQSGRTLSGQTVEAFWASISHFKLAGIGFNCAFGPEQMRPHLETLSNIANCPISCYPNAGLPNEFGEYDLSPEKMAQQVAEFATSGLVNMVGGCCGTTPEHIAAIRQQVSKTRPRLIPQHDGLTRLSGLEELCIRPEANFINIGERCNVAGSRKFARLIREEKYSEALSVARQQVDDGAQIIDVCMDDGLLDGAQCMQRFLDLLAAEPDISKLPIMVDSSDWQVIETGLKSCQGRCLLNSISLKDGEEQFVKRAQLAQKYGAVVVVMAFDEGGQAVDVERRVQIVERSRQILLDLGFESSDIVFDLNVLAVATGISEHDNYAKSFIATTKILSDRYPGILISGGISNLSFSFRGANQAREALHSVFLYHAIAAGMKMGIVNAGQLAVYSQLDSELRELAEDVVLAKHPEAGDRLLEWVTANADQTNAQSRQLKQQAWRKLPLDQRLAHALIHGIDDHLESDLPEILEIHQTALAVIEGPLMAGMNQVGELFGRGEMFLPQVVKSARVMKKAVAWLQPYLAKDGDEVISRGTVLLATVKGDVHDIGKNIVSVVLACNGYRVEDMGVMVPCEDIIKRAQELDTDLIGLSGLITPSLKEMTHFARELKRLGIATPLLIGGATTSPVHTAVKIAPACCSPVVQVADASQSVAVVSKLLAKDAHDFIELNRQQQQKLRTQREQRLSKRQHSNRKPLELSVARQRKVNLLSEPPPAPRFTGAQSVDIDVSDVRGLIDWRPFFKAWSVEQDSSALRVEAEQCLDELIAADALTINAQCGFWPAISKNETIVLDSKCRSEFTFPRQLRDAGEQRANCCLADFINPVGGDYLGAFSVCITGEYQNLSSAAAENLDDFKSLQIKLLADRLAEAAAEYLHQKVRKELWAYAPEEQLSCAELISEKYQGIRPAPGYPACPEHAHKAIIQALLGGSQQTAVNLTESYAMHPAAAVCGFFFARPEAHYFGVGNEI